VVSQKIKPNLAAKSRFVVLGLLAGTIALGASLSQWLNCQAAPPVKARGASGQTVNHQTANSQAIPAEISRLWQAPSAQFAAAVANLGSDPRDVSIANLRRFLDGQNIFNSSNTERLVASYALARLLAKSNSGADQNDAVALFTQAQALPLLHIDSLWHASEILTSQGDNKKTRDFIEKILRDPAAAPSDQARALYEMAQSLLREPSSDNNQKAKDLLLTIKQKYPATEYGTACNYYLGQLALGNSGNNSSSSANNTTSVVGSEAVFGSSTGSSTGNTAGNYGSMSSGAIGAPGSVAEAEALAYFSDYLKGSVNGRFSSDVADKLMAMNTRGAALTPADLDRIGLVYYRKNNYSKALDAFNRAGTNNNQYRKAQCLAKLHRKPESVAALLAAIRQAPEAAYYDDFADVVTGPLSRTETADVWKQILAIKPVKLDHALWNIAVRASDTDATPLFQRLIKEYPTSEHAPEAMWWMFWHRTKVIYPAGLAKNKLQAEALASMAENAALRYPTHRSAARFLFWAGKIHEHLGDHNKAKVLYQQSHNLYPSNYYAFRSLARLAYLNAPADKRRDRGWSTNAQRNCLDNWSWPQPPTLFSFERVARFAGPKVALLAAARQLDECQTALAEAPEANTSNREDIIGLRSWLYLSQGMIMEGIRAAGKDLEGKPNHAPLWQITYPWAYAARIKEQGQLRKVDPYLIHALIREESRYFPKALSRSQALGLMQLLPATAAGVGKRIGVPALSREDVFNPDNNIKLGTAYLEYTLKRFNGNAMLAVASYNGGPNAVKSWVDRFNASGGGGKDWDYFVEEIPFRETRDYVRKVFGSYFVYETLY
jgi:soluble lytic murein transglycosylase-like protein/TolA-binding protein